MDNLRFKFRAWDKEYKEMILPVEGGTVPQEAILFDGTILYLEEDILKGTAKVKQYFKDDLILMQSTGLKDKNGKLIFEGDIVDMGLLGRDKDKFAIVESHENDPTRIVGRYIVNHPQWCDYQWDGLDNTCEIIGNKYENPELLKS